MIEYPKNGWHLSFGHKRPCYSRATAGTFILNLLYRVNRFDVTTTSFILIFTLIMPLKKYVYKWKLFNTKWFYLQKVFLLWIFFKRHKKFACIRFLWENDVAQSLKNKHWSQLIIERIAIDGLDTNGHEIFGFIHCARSHVFQKFKHSFLGLINKLSSLDNKSAKKI